MASLQGHNGGVLSVAFSPDGKQLATGSGDNTTKLWDLASGTCTASLQGHSGYVFSVAFSPDGKQLATGIGDRQVWDTAIAPIDSMVFFGLMAPIERPIV